MLDGCGWLSVATPEETRQMLHLMSKNQETTVDDAIAALEVKTTPAPGTAPVPAPVKAAAKCASKTVKK